MSEHGVEEIPGGSINEIAEIHKRPAWISPAPMTPGNCEPSSGAREGCLMGYGDESTPLTPRVP